jgi:hypothetical protein
MKMTVFWGVTSYGLAWETGNNDLQKTPASSGMFSCNVNVDLPNYERGLKSFAFS